ncbi:uncharacterized protein LOC143362001 [Halictus rubicundus]|uniref:uncharacterized protein LOC143362001 n=1 Tax=Halictus rubicundus TaxID=77578 RepID=UPI004036CB92
MRCFLLPSRIDFGWSKKQKANDGISSVQKTTKEILVGEKINILPNSAIRNLWHTKMTGIQTERISVSDIMLHGEADSETREPSSARSGPHIVGYIGVRPEDHY